MRLRACLSGRSRRRTRRAHLATFLLASVAVIGCGSSVAPSDSPPPTAVAPPIEVALPANAALPIIKENPTGVELSALGIGELQLRGECLVLRTEGYDEPHLILWPEGTTWDGLTRTVVSDAARLRVGDTIILSGGERSGLASDDNPNWVVPPSQECRDGFDHVCVTGDIILD